MNEGTGTNGISEPRKLTKPKPRYPTSGEKNGKKSQISIGYQVIFSVLNILYIIITKIFQFTIKINLTENENGEICDLISKISPYIRFVGIISKTGELVTYFRREGLEPLLDQKTTRYQFAQIAIKTELEEQFDEQLGETKFVWEERTKIQTIAFSVSSKRIWISIDKNVIRTEVIRIIDGCLPIVKRYS